MVRLTLPLRAAACLVAASTLTAACGLQDRPRPGSGTAEGAAADVADAPAATPEPTQAPAPVVPVAVPAAVPSTAAPVAAAAASPAATRPAPRVPPAAPDREASPSPQPATTTGIDPAARTISIALHSSGQGAAGATKYWDQGGPDGGPRLVRGFRVRVEVLDGTANSQSAVRACNAAGRRVFLIVSDADIDQVAACAQSSVLRRGGVPYLALGRTETGLGRLAHYFATSLTYRQQSSALVAMAREQRFLDARWAVLVREGSELEPVRDSAVAQLQAAGARGRAGAFDPERDVLVVEHPASSCESVAQELRAGGYGAVYVLGLPPLLLAQCVQGHPDAVYTGPGPSYATQPLAELMCQATGRRFRGYFLHPVPDPRTAQREAQGAPAPADDAEVRTWAAMQMLEQALLLPEEPLSRETFTAALAGNGTRGGVLPATSYAGRTRFGGTAAYGNRISCGREKALVTTVGRYRSTNR